MSDKEYALQQFSQVRARIDAAARDAGRSPEEIRLIGAAKQQSAAKVRHFLDAGLRDIGQNYLQEALEVKTSIPPNQTQWHYIGRIQSNKTALISTEFDWVHSIDRLKIARRLGSQREHSVPLKVLLQVDIDDEPSKGGVSPTSTVDLVSQVLELDNLEIRGFMVLPKVRGEIQDQRKPFAETRELLERCNQKLGISMDTLSMGMSGDLEAAVLEGSTMVRIGTDLFGARK